MWFILFIFISIFFGQQSVATSNDVSSHNILLATITCKMGKQSSYKEIMHSATQRAVTCSHILLEKNIEQSIEKKTIQIPSCSITYVKHDHDVSLHMQFDPNIILVKIEKNEDKEGIPLIICYFYDKKIIEALEYCTQKSILQYTFNYYRSFSFQNIYVKT